MPEVMLRYRAGAFLVRFYAADVLLGLYTDSELETIPAEPATVVQVKPAVARPTLAARIAQAADDAPIRAEQERVREVIEAPISAVETTTTEPKQLTPGQRKAVDAAKALGIDAAILEARVNKSAPDWTRDDLTALSTFIQAERAKQAPAADEEGA
jgi:hypothetical protein